MLNQIPAHIDKLVPESKCRLTSIIIHVSRYVKIQFTSLQCPDTDMVPMAEEYLLLPWSTGLNHNLFTRQQAPWDFIPRINYFNYKTHEQA